MPNWCRNEIKFNFADTSNAQVMLEAILEYVKETIPNFNARVKLQEKEDDKRKLSLWEREVKHRRLFDFESIVPYPEEFRKRDEDAVTLSAEDFVAKYGDNMDGYNSGGYKWCVENWGSKWNATDIVWVPQQKTFYFDTAWSPVFKIVSELHKRFPETSIYFEYYERGMGTMGGCEFVPEEDWDPADYVSEEVHSIEMRLKRGEVTDETWAAGRAYNPWVMDYMGFKGG